MNHSNSISDSQLLDLLLAEEGVQRCSIDEIRPDDSTPPPLSRSQRRLWFLQRSAPASPAYNVQSAIQLCGALHEAAFEQALNEIVQRHALLRSCFPTVRDLPTVQVLPHLTVQPDRFDLSGLPENKRQQEVRRHLAADASRPFDLAHGPLLRVRLLQLDELRHVVILAMHHIVTDGWSMGIFVEEFRRLYTEFSAGRPSPLGELEIQYSDYARWQEQWLSSSAASEQLAWWKKALDGLATLELPTDRVPPAEPTSKGASLAFRISAPVTAAIKSLARQEDATLFMTLMAAFSVLLHRYCQQDDVVVGTPIANRNRRELDPLIGFFVNSLVMRNDLSGDPSFRTLLQRVRAFALEAYAHQDVPFDVLVNELVPDRGASRNPLFQVMFSVENAQADPLDLPDLTITPLEVDSPVAKFDLLLNMSDTPTGLVGAFEYSVELFHDDTITRMRDLFEQLLSSIVANPDESVATLPLLNDDQRRQLLVDWNDNRTDYPRDASIHHLFERQAARSPGAIALEFGPQRMSYRELNARANQVARLLQARGVGLKSPVAIHIHRSADMVVGLLGILKAGGFYVPLDPDYPAPRLVQMLDDCRASVILTESNLVANLPQRDADVICLDAQADVIERHSDGPIDEPHVDGEHLAYVIYTSGSTGLPKGVAVPHRAVNRLVLNTNYIHIQADDRIAQASNASFDAATFEIWGALLNGARLVGVKRDLALSPPQFADFLRERRITTLFLTTALFNQMARDVPDGFATLRHVLFGGELVDPHWVRTILRQGPPKRLLHVYGPTENTTFSSWYLVREVPSEAPTVPIGKAISNSQLYVLDPRLQPVPVGVPGELYVGGAGLARGYLNCPDVTEECFIGSPFHAGQRLYKTGDMVRWLPTGDIEFMGRRDHQVKIRGFRIELWEIEAWLLRQPRVRDAVVVAREDRPGHRELVAYVVPAGDPLLLESELRTDIAQQLPGYMVPARFALLEKLPMNVNGKVDRRALPEPPETSRESDRASEPQNDLEQMVAGVWQSVLGGRELGVNDNYFHLGGDSITAIQLVSRLKHAGWELSVGDLFRHPTIRSLARILRRSEPRGKPPQHVVTGPVPLTPIQGWFFEEHTGDLQHFNQSILLKSAERLEAAALREVFQRLWEHHDALRMTYAFNAEGVSQKLGEDIGTPGFELVDLQHEQDEVDRLQARADQVQGSFDLRRGPLFKAVLFRLKESDRLLLVIHHLAVDGVSWRILLEDLQRGYAQSLRGEAVTFDPKTDSFQRWAQELQRFVSSESALADQAYWSNVLGRDVPAFPRDTDDARPNLYGDSETVHMALSAEETSLLLTETHQAYDTEVNDLLLTALGRALKTRHGNRQALITLEGHGRERLDMDLDLNRTIGWFTCWYPLLLPTGEGDLGEQIRQVRQALRAIPKRGLSFGLLRYLTPPHLAPSVRAPCRPQLSFNHLGQFEVGDDSSLGFAAESSGQAISPRLTRLHDLDVIGLVTAGRLSLSITFNHHYHRWGSVQQLLDDFRAQLLLVAKHCATIRPREAAPRQFTFSQLSDDDRDRILQSFSEGP